MKRNLIAYGALAGVMALVVGCSEGPKSIPPKTENTRLPTTASSGGPATPKTPTNAAKAD